MSSRKMPRRDKLRPKTSRTGPRDFDNISDDEVMRAAPYMSRVFARYAFIAALLHIVVIAVTAGEFLLVPWWTLYGRAVVVLRLLLLLFVATFSCCHGVVHVAMMYGSGAEGKTLRALRPTPVLAVWLILGYIDLYLVRIPSLVLDAASGLIPDSGQSVEAGMLRAAIGLAVVFEFHLTLNLVYQQGIRRNVLYNLLMRAQQSQARTV